MSREKLELTQEWDKTFPESDQVNHRKVTFDKIEEFMRRYLNA